MRANMPYDPIKQPLPSTGFPPPSSPSRDLCFPSSSKKNGVATPSKCTNPKDQTNYSPTTLIQQQKPKRKSIDNGASNFPTNEQVNKDGVSNLTPRHKRRRFLMIMKQNTLSDLSQDEGIRAL
jgi:hypothetical protein